MHYDHDENQSNKQFYCSGIEINPNIYNKESMVDEGHEDVQHS